MRAARDHGVGRELGGEHEQYGDGDGRRFDDERRNDGDRRKLDGDYEQYELDGGGRCWWGRRCWWYELRRWCGDVGGE